MAKINYIETTVNKLDTIPISSGNMIIVKDSTPPCIYYDTLDNTRKSISNLDNINNDIDTLNTQMSDIVQQDLPLKVDKVTGKGLSTNDYDNTEKAEVAKVKNKAEQSSLDIEKARIDNLVANNGSQTVGNTELIDMRTDSNGVVNATAGGAVRSIGDGKSELAILYNNTDFCTFIDSMWIGSGSKSVSNGIATFSGATIVANGVNYSVTNGKKVRIVAKAKLTATNNTNRKSNFKLNLSVPSSSNIVLTGNNKIYLTSDYLNVEQYIDVTGTFADTSCKFEFTTDGANACNGSVAIQLYDIHVIYVPDSYQTMESFDKNAVKQAEYSLMAEFLKNPIQPKDLDNKFSSAVTKTYNNDNFLADIVNWWKSGGTVTVGSGVATVSSPIVINNPYYNNVFGVVGDIILIECEFTVTSLSNYNVNGTEYKLGVSLGGTEISSCHAMINKDKVGTTQKIRVLAQLTDSTVKFEFAEAFSSGFSYTFNIGNFNIYNINSNYANKILGVAFSDYALIAKTIENGVVTEKALSDKLSKLIYPTYSYFLLPEYYAGIGLEFNMYFNHIFCFNDTDVYYKVNCTGLTINMDDKKVSFTPSTTGTYTLEFTVYKKGTNVLLLYVSTSIVCVSTTTATIKGIMLGDSLTAGISGNGTTIGSILKSNLTGLTLYGTLGTSPYLNEGRPSWATSHYLTSQSYSGMNNAFYNVSLGTDSKFDFSYYMTNNPTFNDTGWVNVFLGQNDGYDPSFIARLETIIDSIQAYNPNIIITIMMAHFCGDTKSNGGRRIYNGIERNKMMYASFGNRESEKIYIVPQYINVDDYYDYPRSTKQLSARNSETVEYLTDTVHPYSYGYAKMADVLTGVISYIKSL